MAVTGREPLRVTIGDAVRDLAPDAPGEFEPTGPGAGILRTAAGPRRVLWAGRAPRGLGAPDGAGPGAELEIVVDGWRFVATLEPAARAALRERARRGAAAVRAHAALIVRAPIPGRIGAVRVVEGQAVEAGEALLTLEAMKMENVVRAPRAGTIGRVAVGAGQTVELGDTLVELA